MIRVLLVDDHSIVREGFKRLITNSPSFMVVAEAAGAQEAMAELRQVQVDIALIDLHLGAGGRGGLELLAQIRDRHPELRCVILSMHDSPELVARAFQQGAWGYFTKSVAAEELLQGMQQVAQGQRALSSDLGRPTAAPPVHLTQRERETLRGLVSNRTPKEIAFSLGISDKTLYRHRANVMEKLGVRSAGELARICRERGLLIDLDE